jgi:cell division inhibitor SepF
MPNWINSAREFLGLGQDPYYDDEYDDEPHNDDEPRDEPRARPVRPAPPRPGRPEADWEEGDGGVRMIGTTVEAPVAVAAGPPVAAPGSERGVVRPLPTASKPEVVSPTRFDDVQRVADAFKKVQPVIVNLQGVDRDLSRRLIDFASGLCYGLEGEMERVAEQVFLLTPKGAEVSDDDRRRLEEGRVAEYDR